MDLKISIIVAVFNGEKFLKRLLESIENQIHKPHELIIIDGNSTDGTLDIIKNYPSLVSSWVSESDEGIYDAWNKGISYATGDWIMFLGADDILLPDGLAQYTQFVYSLGTTTNEIDFISSQVEMIDHKEKTTTIKGGPWKWPQFLYEMTTAHPGSLHSKQLFQNFGLYNTSYKITGDYELLLRPKSTLKTAYLPKVTVKMSEGGASDSIAAIYEHKRAAVETGEVSKIAAILNSYLVMIKFNIKRALRILQLR